MVAEQLRDFLENGNIRNSVNFPEAVLPRMPGTTRLAIANRNVPNMVGQISTCLAAAQLNIADLLNKSRGEYAYTLIDTDGAVGEEAARQAARHRRAYSRPAFSERPCPWPPVRRRKEQQPAPSRGAKPLRLDLAAVRARIDAVDEQIHALHQRARAPGAAGRHLQDADGHTVDFYRPEREAQVLRRRASAMPDRCATRRCCGCSARSCRRAWRSRSRSKSPSSGPRARSRRPRCSSTSDTRCARWRSPPSMRCFTKSRPAAADFGVVPIENSSEGTVNQHARSIPELARCRSAARWSCASTST